MMAGCVLLDDGRQKNWKIKKSILYDKDKICGFQSSLQSSFNRPSMWPYFILTKYYIVVCKFVIPRGQITISIIMIININVIKFRWVCREKNIALQGISRSIDVYLAELLSSQSSNTPVNCLVTWSWAPSSPFEQHQKYKIVEVIFRFHHEITLS